MEGDMIMDICFGSNTTGIAALEMNRRYIGIEKDEKYFNIGKDRISRD
jgi:DNA modification methylase